MVLYGCQGADRDAPGVDQSNARGQPDFNVLSPPRSLVGQRDLDWIWVDTEAAWAGAAGLGGLLLLLLWLTAMVMRKGGFKRIWEVYM